MTKELHIPLLENVECCQVLVWHAVAVQAPIGPTLWVRTRSGIVATGRFDGMWIVDGTRIKDSYDEITHWAEIEHPRGPRVPSAATN